MSFHNVPLMDEATFKLVLFLLTNLAMLIFYGGLFSVTACMLDMFTIKKHSIKRHPFAFLLYVVLALMGVVRLFVDIYVTEVWK